MDYPYSSTAADGNANSRYPEQPSCQSDEDNDNPTAAAAAAAAAGPGGDGDNGSTATAAAAADPLLPPIPPKDRLTIVLRDGKGFSQAYKLKPTTDVSKAIDAFCATVERSPQSLRFLIDGVRLNRGTIEENELEDGDLVEVMEEQFGGDGGGACHCCGEKGCDGGKCCGGKGGCGK